METPVDTVAPWACEQWSMCCEWCGLAGASGGVTGVFWFPWDVPTTTVDCASPSCTSGNRTSSVLAENAIIAMRPATNRST